MLKLYTFWQEHILEWKIMKVSVLIVHLAQQPKVVKEAYPQRTAQVKHIIISIINM